MNKYYIYDKNMGYLCKEKGSFTPEDKGPTLKVMIFWSNFIEPVDRRIKYIKIRAVLEIFIMKLFDKTLNPILIKTEDYKISTREIDIMYDKEVIRRGGTIRIK